MKIQNKMVVSSKELHRVVPTVIIYNEAKNYDLIDGMIKEIEMIDKILKGRKNNF